jgi:hypothetical protein
MSGSSVKETIVSLELQYKFRSGKFICSPIKGRSWTFAAINAASALLPSSPRLSRFSDSGWLSVLSTVYV